MKTGAWRQWAQALKTQVRALYIAARDPRVPVAARILIVIVVAYALSPIDLIPDFIPVIGYLDDLLLLPAGIWLAVRLIPDELWQDCQARARQQEFELAPNRAAAAIITLLWLLAIIAMVAAAISR